MTDRGSSFLLFLELVVAWVVIAFLLLIVVRCDIYHDESGLCTVNDWILWGFNAVF